VPARCSKDVGNERLTQNWDDRIKNLHDQVKTQSPTGSLLEKVFGKIDDFQQYKAVMDTAQATWNSLTAGVGAGYEAMVTGSQSFGKAFKHAMGDSLLASGKQMQIEAIKEGAMGVASLALGPIGGASAGQHFAAAALFEAGAIAAGVAAHELGAGGGTGSAGGKGGAGSVPSVANSNAPAPAPTTREVVIVDDPFAAPTTRQRANNIDRALRAAVGNSGTRKG
jgi:hypothetical protein